MGLCFIVKLLLTTLVIHLTEQNAEWETQTTIKPENAVRYGEFCLRIISDDSPVPEPVTQPVRPMSAHLTKNTTQLPKPAPLKPENPTNTGCQCNKEEMKQPTEVSSILDYSTLTIRFPSENCPSIEIETVKDGKKVCVTNEEAQIFLLKMLTNALSPHQPLAYNVAPSTDLPTSTPPTSTPPTSTPPTSTLKETTQDSSEEIILSSSNKDLHAPTGHKDNTSSPELDDCKYCDFAADSYNIDPESVQSLKVKLSCILFIFVHLKDGKVFCVFNNQPQLKAMLEKLDYLHANEDISNHIQNNITDECRCQDKKETMTTDETSVNSIMIWLMSEKCNSTEYIETLKNGTEVCVTAPGIIAFLDVQRYSPLKPLIQYDTIKPDLQMTRLKPLIHYDTYEPALEMIKDAIAVKGMSESAVTVCMHCIRDSWTTIEPKDVESVQMRTSPNCPDTLDVILKNKTSICVDSSKPWFNDVLILTLTVIKDDA